MRRSHILGRLTTCFCVAFVSVASATAVRAQADTSVRVRNDSVTIRLVNVDLRDALQALGQYLDRPVLHSGLSGMRVTLETPRPVLRSAVPGLVRSLVESQGLEFVVDSVGDVYRVRQKPASPGPSIMTVANQTHSQTGVQLFVVHLSHARAADVAATVNSLYGRASAVGELGSSRPGTLSDQLRENARSSAEAMMPARPDVVAGVAGRSAVLTSESTIVPDPATNSLFIRASPGDFELIKAAISELDIRPLQVLIEVLIAEVRRDRTLDFGVSTTVPDAKVGSTQSTTVGGSIAGAGSLGDFVIHVMKTGGVMKIDATLRAAAARGDARIVSRPVVIAANNERAEILVGSQRPFVQIARTQPTDAASRDQVVQYRDVGTKLTVKPTISADGYVMLEVTQEVNNATGEASAAALNAPIISTRTLQTRLLVKDSQTVVLGGLTDHQRDHSQGGVPFLSSIPWIGGLFGRTHDQNVDTEFFLFLTPRVLRTDEETKSITEPFGTRAKKAEQ